MNDDGQTSTYNSLNDKEEKRSLVLGLLGAIVGGLIGSIPWMIAYNFNWVLSILGAAIGFCAMKGYELGKGPEGVVKKVSIITISLIIVVFAQYVVGVLYAYQAMQGMRFSPTILDTVEIFNELLFSEPEFQRAMLADTGIGIFFALLGLSGLFKGKTTDPFDNDGATDTDEITDDEQSDSLN